MRPWWNSPHRDTLIDVAGFGEVGRLTDLQAICGRLLPVPGGQRFVGVVVPVHFGLDDCALDDVGGWTPGKVLEHLVGLSGEPAGCEVDYDPDACAAELVVVWFAEPVLDAHCGPRHAADPTWWVPPHASLRRVAGRLRLTAASGPDLEVALAWLDDIIPYEIVRFDA